MITLIDFYADWCGPCQAMKPILEKVISSYSDRVNLEKVNVDQDQKKAAEYGVMSIPTLVMLKDGKEVDRKVGLLFEPVLKQWVESHLS